MSLTLKYDQSVDAAYIYLRKIKPGEVDKTISLEFTSGLAKYPLRLDLTRSGELVGLEFLDASNILPKDLLEETE